MGARGTYRRAMLAASVGLWAMLAAGAAHAQIQAEGVQDDGLAEGEEEDAIIVTAQKREEILIDIPQSVTVVGGETLERQQATNFQDYLALVPGLSLESSTPGVTQITLRGVNTGGVASTVSVYVDEVPFGSSTGLANGGILSGDFDPFDVARLEVLRGPQGTLYGASSLGGVIKYVTNQPRLNMFEARAQVGVEDTSGGAMGYQGAALVNVPVGDRVAVRANAFYRLHGGYVDTIGNNPIVGFGPLTPLAPLVGLDPNQVTNEGTRIDENINDRESYGGRISALFQATDALSIRLTAFVQNLNSGSGSEFEVDPETLEPLYGGYTQSRYQEEWTKIKYRVYSGTVDWELGFANLLSSTSYSTFLQDFQSDATFALGGIVSFAAALGPDAPGLLGFGVTDVATTRPLGLVLRQNTATDKFTQEVRLSSPDNDTFEWLVGGFYTDERSAIDPQSYFATEGGTETLADDIFQLTEIFLRSDYEEYAGFANGTWHISPRFDITAGGRLSHNKQSADLLITGPLAGGTSTAEDLNSSETVFTYSVAPRFEITNDSAIYARVASGYRPGGPNVLPVGSPPDVPTTYDADRLTSYEVGFKGEWLNRRFGLDIAAFYLDWTDIQLFAIVNDTGINTNGGTAEVKGVEFTATARPVRGLTILANGAYTDAELTQDAPTESGGFAGDPLPYVPKWSGAINADYEWPLTGDAEGFVGATFSYVGERPSFLSARDENGDIRRIPGYESVDLRAGVNFGDFGVQAYVNNVFNTRGITSAFGFDPGSNPNNAGNIAIIRPRTIGLLLTAGF